MNNKDLLDMVKDFPAWGGNTYTLASQIMQRQREDAALIAESMGKQEVADAIRGAV